MGSVERSMRDGPATSIGADVALDAIGVRTKSVRAKNFKEWRYQCDCARQVGVEQKPRHSQWALKEKNKEEGEGVKGKETDDRSIRDERRQHRPLVGRADA